MEMWKGRGRVLILASRGPVDVGEEDLQPLPAVDILDAAPTEERRVDMVAGGDEDGFAVDRHLSKSLDEIIELVECAYLRDIGRASSRERASQYVYITMVSVS